MATSSPSHLARPRRQGQARTPKPRNQWRKAALAMIATTSSLAVAADCISLKGSSMCPAFQSASVSTAQDVTNFYGFMSFVDGRQSFDDQFQNYLNTGFIRDKFVNTFRCQDVKLSNNSALYARYTTTVICNALVQLSKSNCNLSDNDSRPLCADTCAEYAQSEVFFTSDSDYCSRPSNGLSDLIRADFVTCSLPRGALMNNCIAGSQNEPENCGYGNSTVGLCSYCAEGGTNSTDSCCYGSNAEKKCKNVQLPTLVPTMIFTAAASSSTSTATGSRSSSAQSSHTSTTDGGRSTHSPDSDSAGNGGSHHHGLSGGAIAGIVIGSIVGVVLIAALLFFCLRAMRRRGGSQTDSILNQPSPTRRGPSMSQRNQDPPSGYEVLPGGRIARMSALEGHSGDSPTHHHGNSFASGAAGFGAGYAASKNRGMETQSSSDEHYESPTSGHGPLRPPPMNPRRHGSLSSGSALGGSVPQSPTSGDLSSPPGVDSQQSEQLPFFKDYYSQDDIHPSDRVAVLWAYQPRATDEFALERGDMLKVVGIWDDGWATGVMVDERAENWEARRGQRDSGVSNTSGNRDTSPMSSGEIKAFPLVCVCLPEHWKKTIDGDVSTDSGTNYNIAS